MRIAFFGTPAFAVPTLEALAASRHRVVLVVSQPDRPRGRGHRVESGPVKRAAERHALPVVQPERLKDQPFLGALAASGADLGVVAAYGRILPDAVLSLPPRGLLNVHASLLPKYRGAAPVHRAVMAGESETGVTIMRIVRELDAGPMLASRTRPIGADETSEDVERDLAEIGARLMVETLDAVETGRVSEVAQDERLATYAPRITKDEGPIDWARSAAEIHNQVRGLHPWPHAWTWHGERRLVVLRTAVGQPGSGDGRPGTIVEAHGDRLEVAAGGGSRVRLISIQREGGRPLGAREFLAGHRLRAGDRFGAAPEP